MTRPVAVVGAGAYVAGFGSLDAWAQAAASDDVPAPDASIIPARQRRRASVLSRAAADAYASALGASGFDGAEVASVFGSALGESETMIELLDQMWGDAPMLSPMKFAMSVHNAASGLVSIATGNRGFTTSLGADFDTPAMALMEAIGWVLSEDRPVIVCCGDEAPPEHLVPGGAGWALLTAAVTLAPVEQAPPDAPRLVDLDIRAGTLAPFGDVPGLVRNPCVGLLDLVTGLSRGDTGVMPLDRGSGRGYAISIEAAQP